MTHARRTLAALALAAACLAAAPASAQSRVRVGTLDCVIEAGIGLVLGSSRAINCNFISADRSRSENYTGNIDKLGIDIGVTDKARMVWAVFAPTRVYTPGFLAGDYGGAAADASIIVGGGAKLLIGGSNRTVSLQPLSLQGQTGLNIAIGISALHLNPAR